MPIVTDYASLQAEVARKLRRPDLGADIPGYIAGAETKLNGVLRTAYQIAQASTALDEEWESLPGDCLDVDTLHLRGAPPRRLDYLTPSQFLDTVAGQVGTPAYYTVIGRRMRFAPIPAGAWTLEMSYFAALPPLSEASPSNWLLARAPMVYLYGALVEAYADLREMARGAEYLTMQTIEIDRLNKERSRSFGAAGPLRVRTAGPKP